MTVVKNNPDFTDSDSSEALPTEQVEETVEETEEEESADEVVESEEVEEEIKPEPEVVPSVPAKIKIGDQEFDESELKDIVTKGSKIKEWETKMPGFNVDTFMPDYTQKSQRLAAYEKRSAPKAQVQPKELEELGVDDTQVKAFEKVAKHLGFVRQTDLIQDSIEAQKDAFIARHPEYAPGSPVNDEKWGQLKQEFDLYDWKNNPDKVEKFLEKAHADVSKSWIEAERGNKVMETITTKKAQVAATVAGGGSGKGATITPNSSNTALANKYRQMGWDEEDIKEILS